MDDSGFLSSTFLAVVHKHSSPKLHEMLMDRPRILTSTFFSNSGYDIDADRTAANAIE